MHMALHCTTTLPSPPPHVHTYTNTVRKLHRMSVHVQGPPGTRRTQHAANEKREESESERECQRHTVHAQHRRGRHTRGRDIQARGHRDTCAQARCRMPYTGEVRYGTVRLLVLNDCAVAHVQHTAAAAAACACDVPPAPPRTRTPTHTRTHLQTRGQSWVGSRLGLATASCSRPPTA